MIVIGLYWVCSSLVVYLENHGLVVDAEIS